MRRLMRNKMAVTSAIIIVLFALLAISAPILPLHPPVQYQSRETDVGGGGTRLPPAWIQDVKEGAPKGNSKFWLGTDASGRDVLSRVIY